MIAACPTCRGSGEARVGLVGFDLQWKARCPDCDGSGELGWWTLQRVNRRNARRLAMDWPLTMPGGSI